MKTISADVTDKLRKSIMNGDFHPNERLVEDELAMKFNTSRTPIRDAIKNLSTIGLVKSYPNKGAVVADIDFDEMKEIYVIRASLEGLATKLAAKNIPCNTIIELENMLTKMNESIIDGNMYEFEKWNTLFHMTIYKYSNNKSLCSMIQDLLDKSILFRRSSWISLSKVEMVMKSHNDLLKAIIDKDELLAQKIIEEHISFNKVISR